MAYEFLQMRLYNHTIEDIRSFIDQDQSQSELGRDARRFLMRPREWHNLAGANMHDAYLHHIRPEQLILFPESTTGTRSVAPQQAVA